MLLKRKGPKPRPISERFWEKVKKSKGCWEWTAAKDGCGYGIFLVSRKCLKAHRVAWALVNGGIPEGKHVLHDCDNPPCVRPAHLHLGTHADNLREASERTTWKMRDQRGEKNFSAKLTNRDVSAIRRLLSKGVQQKIIAKQFCVSRATICFISKGQRWASS